MKKILTIIYWCIVIFALGWAFLSQIETGKVGSAIIKDGLGRPLFQAPYLLRYLFGTGKLWSGLKGLTIDYLIFFCGIIAVYQLGKSYVYPKCAKQSMHKTSSVSNG